ncbi:four helix bundle protein [Candidatus Nomurabacteria bacterium]|nr:four helix bundle protein [Candidatus Nomurabacteria bacterium]
MLVRAKEAYQFWHKLILNLSRIDRYTTGARIDEIFLSLLESIFRGCFAFDKFEKISIVSQAIAKNDLLKFFMQIAWEQKIVSHKNYADLISFLDEIGKMLGGWKRNLENKTPAKK